MLRYVIKRLILLVPTLIGITILVQLLIVITPGDPARVMAGTQATEEEVNAIREDMGLNDPIFIRYVNYLKDLLRGNFGISHTTKRPVSTEILQRLPYTLLLVAVSMGLAVAIGVPIGVYAATHQYSWKDNFAVVLSLFCVSMPTFWFALILIKYLCVKYQLLPVAGVDSWLGWILPCVTTALAYMASITRQMRSNMLEVIRQDYIVTARAKGQSEGKILYSHALKNALIPIIMTVGQTVGVAIGGSMITEVVFSIPGLGSYMINALNSRDYPVIQSGVLIIAALFCIVLLLVDLAFAFIDPRIRAQYARRKKKSLKAG